jgi:hypothetical protein
VTTRHGEQVLSAAPPAQVQGCVQTVRSEGRERTEEQDIYVLAGLGQGWWRQQVVCVAQGHVAGTDPKHALQGLGVRPAVLTARSGR